MNLISSIKVFEIIYSFSISRINKLSIKLCHINNLWRKRIKSVRFCNRELINSVIIPKVKSIFRHRNT